MLRHEHEVYKRLEGVTGIAKCYGLIANTYLAIEFIESDTIRKNRPDNDSDFYDQLLEIIHQLHQRKIAHMDLKKKENLLVGADGKPYVIDFGAAVIYKPGLHLINHYLYSLACRFDYNAWIKHKYMGRMAEISDADKRYYNRSVPEKIASKLKRSYLRIKRSFNR
jgi:serine/threonine protein kinase